MTGPGAEWGTGAMARASLARRRRSLRAPCAAAGAAGPRRTPAQHTCCRVERGDAVAAGESEERRSAAARGREHLLDLLRRACGRRLEQGVAISGA